MSQLYVDAIVYCAVALVLGIFFVVIIAAAFAPCDDDDRPSGGGMWE